MRVRQNHLGQDIGFALEGWEACLSPTSSVMIGQYCRLEALDVEKHGQELFDAFCSSADKKNWTYLPYGPFETYDDFQSWLTVSSANSDPLFFTIINLKTGKSVGLASYLRIEPNTGAIEVGHIHYSPLLQKTPMATEAMFLMMKRVFEEFGYRRYEWKCDTLNQPSKSAALRLGFQFEGIFRQATLYKGRNRDTAWFSILDQEWPALKQALEKWLSHDNFDKNGIQKSKLRV